MRILPNQFEGKIFPKINIMFPNFKLKKKKNKRNVQLSSISISILKIKGLYKLPKKKNILERTSSHEREEDCTI
jgi:hypothetical protein